jgi:hypothetical protein
MWQGSERLKMKNKRDLIRLDKGVFVWYEYPPYTLMLGFKNKSENHTFKNLNEIKLYIRLLTQLKDWVEKTEKKKRR